jgi:D-threo-aldose 1-dehydrogenase
MDDEIIISTKLGGKPSPFLPKDKKCLEQSLNNSLKLLNRDYIDILFIHEPDRPEIYDWWDDDNYSGPVLDFLMEAKRKGIVKYIGLAGTTAYELANIINTGQFDVVLTAFNYSLLWQEAKYEIFPAAKKYNMGIVVGSILQQGYLAERYDEVLKVKPKWMSQPRYEQFLRLYKFSDEINMGLVELSIRNVLSNPSIDCILTGSRSAEEVDHNCDLIEKGTLHPDIIKELNNIANMVPFRPSGEPMVFPLPGIYQKR